LDFLNRAVELLVLAFEFFPWIIIDADVRINAVAFDNPLLAVR
jgi:hypothetical protein